MSVSEKTHAETIADIIAEMRRGTKLPGYWRSCDVNKILQYHADRLDAAHRRERGDCAKLREALKAAELGLFRWLSGSISRDEHRELVATIKAALAAPPRNCDVYTTAEEARQAMLNDAENWDEFGSPKLKLGEWLFAPATEQEGGNNADK